jgi:hypothetical protein
MSNQEIPLITDAKDITLENFPEIFRELSNEHKTEEGL